MVTNISTKYVFMRNREPQKVMQMYMISKITSATSRICARLYLSDVHGACYHLSKTSSNFDTGYSKCVDIVQNLLEEINPHQCESETKLVNVVDGTFANTVQSLIVFLYRNMLKFSVLVCCAYQFKFILVPSGTAASESYRVSAEHVTSIQK